MENIAKEIRIIVSAKLASKPKTSDEFLLSMYDLLKTYNTMINEMDLYDINEKYHSLFPLDKNEIDVINIE